MAKAKIYPILGEMLTISQACRKYKKSLSLVRTRMNRNKWTLEQAIFTNSTTQWGTEEWKRLSDYPRDFNLKKIK